MSEIQIAIEGAGAAAAAAELFEFEGINGSYQVDESVNREGTVAVIGTVVGITVGAMTIGKKLHKWYRGYQAKEQAQRIEKVLIVTPTSRLLLEDATLEEITAALKPLAK
jgi:hypothetical protein